MSGRKARFSSWAARSPSCESRLAQLRDENQKLSDQLAVLNSPVMLDQRVHELNLGLVPAQPTQVYRLMEAPPGEDANRRFAARQDRRPDAMT